MDIIHLLPDSVANQIAAGEVIQRPASCLKELVENSLDAGATRVQIIIKDAGRTLLQVIDNGKGMSETDARMAFERHATSKIKEAADLFALRTMGFRGEALASICAVAQVEVQTRREEDEVGTLLEIAGSNVMRQEPTQCPVGTNIKVKNLFYNVPVRRKFLKTDQTELRNILTDFYRIVLVYPKVQFTLVSQDEVLVELPAGTEKQRIEAIFGKSARHAYTEQLVNIQSDTELVSIRGFVGKPENASKNAQQYFFVNGRYMRHPYFHKALMTAYSGMIQGDVMPSYFVYFDINPEAIDVNIHPTKTEIKFADEQMVFQILLATVREALGKFNIVPSIDFDTAGKIEMPVDTKHIPTTPPHISTGTSYNPFQAQAKPNINNWESLYQPMPKSDMPQKAEITDAGKQTQQALFDEEFWRDEPQQFAGKYIYMLSSQGLIFVDQHRAHMCVLYDMYTRQMELKSAISQQLLFPEVLDVTADEVEHVKSMTEALRQVGFDIEQLDKTSFSISGIPPQMDSSQAVEALKHLIAEVDPSAVEETWKKQLALTLANDAAIAYGKTMIQKEMNELTDQLFALKSYIWTPDGKRVIYTLTDEELKKNFV